MFCYVLIVMCLRSVQIAEESGEPRECVKEEAVSILEEMSQNLQLNFIRLMGFTLTKVFKRLFSSLRVNEDGLARVRDDLYIDIVAVLLSFLALTL